MKLKKGFITHKVGKEQMMVAAGPAAKNFHGLVRSNETAAFIVDRLKQETTEEEIVAAMLERYEASRELVERDVHAVVEKLKSIGAVE
ncbi:MAG: PqqD family protein [Oscillospiraceae bacterium]|nr:PqqD family protein [Oscillospiraceae bacterium]